MLGVLALISFAISFSAARILLRQFSRLALDRPNERSLHDRPVPRTGGIAILAGALASVAFGTGELWLPIVLALVLAAVSFVDDLRGLGTLTRLAAHLAAGGVLVWYVLSPMHAVELVMLAIAVTWITNAYNFMDGSDGLAGGMALIGFGAYAFAAAMAGHAALVGFNIGLSAAAAAFLFLNFPPARIFLGDVGSVPLGFLAGSLGIVGWRDDVWPLWFPVIVFGPFIADATATLLRRLVHGERIWQAHREHYYQRLVRSGAGHRGTALIGYAVMLSGAALALYARDKAPSIQLAAVVAAGLLLTAVAWWIDLRWARYNRAGQAST